MRRKRTFQNLDKRRGLTWGDSGNGRTGTQGDTSWSPDGKRMLLNFAQLDGEAGAEDEETWEIYAASNTDISCVRGSSTLPRLHHTQPRIRVLEPEGSRRNRAV